MVEQQTTPSKLRKFFGYLLGTLKDFLGGFTTGTSLVKIMVWFLGAAIGMAIMPYVFAVGSTLGLIYILRKSYHEYSNNKIESQKLTKKAELDSHIHSLNQPLLDKHSDLRSANHLVLQGLLKEYFRSLESSSGRYIKKSGKYRKQNKILKLIYRATGYNPHSANFHDKMHRFLRDDPQLRSKFNEFFSKKPDGNIQAPSTMLRLFRLAKYFVKKNRRLRHFGKHAFEFLDDFSVGSGMAVSLLALFGLISGVLPVGWPLLIVVVGSGLTYWGISFAYSQSRSNPRRRNIRALTHEIELKQTRVELLERQLKIRRHAQKWRLATETSPEQKITDLSDITAVELQSHGQATIPIPIYFRMGFGIFGRIVSAISLAAILSVSIIWTSALLFPVIPFLAPTLSFGAVLSGFYLYRTLKKELKSIKNEINSIRDLHDMKENLFAKHSANQAKIQSDLQKSNRILLQEVIESYTRYIRSLGNDAHKENGKYPHQEKIFKLIESLIDHTRGDDNGTVLKYGDDLFYNHLASYLSKHCTRLKANFLAQEFKSLFLTKENHHNLTATVKANDPRINKKNALNQMMNFLEQRSLTLAGVLALGIMVPLCLAGPQFLLIGGVAAVMISGFVISSLTSQNAAIEEQQREIDKHKFSLINHKYKLTKLMSQPEYNLSKFLKKDNEDKPEPSSNIAIRRHDETLCSSIRGGDVHNPVKDLSESLTSIWQESSQEAGSFFTPNTNTAYVI